VSQRDCGPPLGRATERIGFAYDRKVSTPAVTAHLACAAALDAAGDHDGAVNELALGTQTGDLPCTRQLGLRLLTGDRAPLLPAEGLRFLGEACDGGLAESAARAAGILALACVAANWPLALAWLCRSAAAGWERRAANYWHCAKTALAAPQLFGPPDWRAVAAAVRLMTGAGAPPPDVKSRAAGLCLPGFVRPRSAMC
jgi:hypothetical protein